MRWIGMALFLVGIGVAGVYASRPAPIEVAEGETADPAERVRAWADVAGVGFGIGAVLMIGGALIARRERGVSEGPGGGHAKGSDTAPALVRQIREKLAAVPEDPARHREAAKEVLDEVLEDLVPRVLDRRDAMIARMGLGAFAEMIGHFATMERNAARAWSALIDEAFDEIPECIERAREGADRALAELDSAYRAEVKP